MKSLLILAAVLFSQASFATNCDIYTHTEGGAYQNMGSSQGLGLGDKIYETKNRIYLLQKGEKGELQIIGLKLPLRTLEGGKFGDPTFVGAVGSASQVTLIDYDGNTSLTCRP